MPLFIQWDFEEVSPQWCSQTEEQPSVKMFPLQDWTGGQKSQSNTSSSSGFCNGSDLKETTASASNETHFDHSDSIKSL